MAVRLDTTDRVVLSAFRALDPHAGYVYNEWSTQLQSAVKLEAHGVEGFDSFWERSLRSLVRRGLLTGEGRGSFRQYGITEKGLEAVAETSRLES